jgi:hypothetical protein
MMKVVAFTFFLCPCTRSVIRYLRFCPRVLAGTVTLALTVPTEQGTVRGSPDTAGLLAVKVQSTASETVADKVALPPVDGTGVGFEAKSETDGGVVTAEIVMSVAVVTLAPDPVAVSSTV